MTDTLLSAPEDPKLREYFAAYGGLQSQLPSIAGSYQGRGLVVCGDGACVWDDLERLGARCNVGRGKVRAPDGWDFMVVNKLGETFPGRILHWYSNEAKLLVKFIEARRAEYRSEFNTQFETHSNHRGAKWHWPLGGHGTSGLGACLVGILLGYDRLVLCGMPLDDGPHNGEPHWRKCRFKTAEVADQVNGAMPGHWKRAKDHAFKGRVKSMSGRTRDWFGEPCGF